MNDSNLRDEELMLSFAKGEVRSFELLYGRHKDALYRYVVRQVTDRELAHDLYQEVWSRIIKSTQTYDVKAKWTTWAYRIAHNLIVDHYRTFKPVDGEIETVSSDSPERSHAQEELSSQLDHCMRRLPSAQLEVFLLSQETELNLKMIADVVNASHEAVKTRLRYARSALKECLQRFGVMPSQSGRGGQHG